jgi:DNA polymerase III subunit epsilon
VRQIILDTETTGLEPEQGHRIVELACVELVNRRFTRQSLHHYLNPERDIDAGAQQVHGLTFEFLQEKPKFADVADDFLAFIAGAELIIHNAAFDVGFLNAELARLGKGAVTDYCECVTDTLRMAKDLHPGKRNSLDILCERYMVNNSARALHGALLDAELLAEVFLAMTRGQESLVIETLVGMGSEGRLNTVPKVRNLTILRASHEEQAAHLQQLEKINKVSRGGCLWLTLVEIAAAPC